MIRLLSIICILSGSIALLAMFGGEYTKGNLIIVGVSGLTCYATRLAIWIKENKYHIED